MIEIGPELAETLRAVAGLCCAGFFCWCVVQL